MISDKKRKVFEMLAEDCHRFCIIHRS